MKKLYLIPLILPLLGCNHTNDNLSAKTGTKNVPSSAIDQNNLNSQPLLNEMTNSPLNTVPSMKGKGTAKNEKMLDVVLIKQNPELRYGCEVTSLAMVLNYAGVKTNKMELYRLIKKDTAPLIKTNGNILRWGNPAHGFVGDMTGRQPGYAVFDEPMIHLINQKLPGRALNLTNQPFDKVLEHVSDGYPVVVWTTGDFRLPDRWEAWYYGQKLIKTPLDLHAVVLVGYDENFVYVNDPLSGRKQVRVNKAQFITSWKALNCRAVSYK